MDKEPRQKPKKEDYDLRIDATPEELRQAVVREIPKEPKRED